MIKNAIKSLILRKVPVAQKCQWALCNINIWASYFEISYRLWNNLIDIKLQLIVKWDLIQSVDVVIPQALTLKLR
jgi:hypothetical protein